MQQICQQWIRISRRMVDLENSETGTWHKYSGVSMGNLKIQRQIPLRPSFNLLNDINHHLWSLIWSTGGWGGHIGKQKSYATLYLISEVQPKPTMTYMPAFSNVLHWLHIIAFSFVIGQTNYFGFGFMGQCKTQTADCRLLNWIEIPFPSLRAICMWTGLPRGEGMGLLLYMGYVDMFCCEGYGLQE